MKLFLALLIVLSALCSEARIFDMNSEKFAAYLGGQYGPTSVGKSPYEKASGFNESYDGEHKIIYGGEFGFIYATRFLNLKFGFEVLRTPALVVSATDAAGTKLYDVSSDISVISPKIGVEFNIKQSKGYRVFIDGEYGQGNLGLTNSYVFTAAGTAATSNTTDYTEEGRASAALIEGSLGIEMLMFDTTTFVLAGGYRSLKFTSITHNRDATTLQGGVVKGNPMINTDGSARTVDLTGYFATMAFRFWIF